MTRTYFHDKNNLRNSHHFLTFNSENVKWNYMNSFMAYSLKYICLVVVFMGNHAYKL